jgi:hypothetical protein
VQNELKNWNLGRSGSAAPHDPIDLSWWVAANLPMEDSQRSLLLRYCTSDGDSKVLDPDPILKFIIIL